jgi:hypothetical protein
VLPSLSLGAVEARPRENELDTLYKTKVRATYEKNELHIWSEPRRKKSYLIDSGVQKPASPLRILGHGQARSQLHGARASVQEQHEAEELDEKALLPNQTAPYLMYSPGTGGSLTDYTLYCLRSQERST